MPRNNRVGPSTEEPAKPETTTQQDADLEALLRLMDVLKEWAAQPIDKQPTGGGTPDDPRSVSGPSSELTVAARAALEQARAYWYGFHGSKNLQSRRIELTIKLLEKARAVVGGPETDNAWLDYRHAAIAREADRIVAEVGALDPSGVGRVSADAWEVAIDEWQGWRRATHGGGARRYSWHRVVYDLLKPHGLVDASGSKRMADAFDRAWHKQAGRSPYTAEK